MGDQLLWAVKNGDLEAVKQTFDKVYIILHLKTGNHDQYIYIYVCVCVYINIVKSPNFRLFFQ